MDKICRYLDRELEEMENKVMGDGTATIKVIGVGGAGNPPLRRCSRPTKSCWWPTP